MASIRKRLSKTQSGEPRTAWQVDWTDTAGKRHRRQFRTKREADTFRSEVEFQVRTGTFRSEAGKMIMADLCDQFLTHCRGRVERDERMTERTYRTYKGHMQNHILDAESGIAAIELRHLTAGRVREFRDRIRNKGTTVATTRRILATLRSALSYAISHDLTSLNVALGVRVIGTRDEGSKKVQAPPKESIGALLNAADPDFRVKLLFAVATGVRAGELHALRWKHLDMENGEVNIIARVDAYRNDGPPKSAAGVRSVPIGDAVLQELREWRLRSRFSSDSDLVFPNAKGRYESHNNMSKRKFKPLMKKAMIDPFSWHALRHFAISCWIEDGMQPKAIQTFAGHSSLQVTMDRYGHLFESDDHKASMDSIAAMIVGA